MNTFRSYIAVYHEAVVANLLEILLYYNTAVMESGGDLLVDVIDWAYGKLVRQVGIEIQKLKQRPEKEPLTPEQKVKQVLEQKFIRIRETDKRHRVFDVYDGSQPGALRLRLYQQPADRNHSPPGSGVQYFRGACSARRS